MHFRIVFVCLLSLNLFLSACSQIIVDVPSHEEEWDQPTNTGVKNVLLNAKQLVSINYTPVNELLIVNGEFSPMREVTGLVYSSSRAEDLFCPNNVSLWTFMSSLYDPQSYLYTKNVTMPPYSIRGLVGSYYGQVCSAFVRYALGIKYQFEIYQMTVWDGFDKVEPQEIDGVRLGDILTSESSQHTRLVTGIHRKEGHVFELAISEGMYPCAIEKTYPVSDVLNSMHNKGYVLYRYRYIDSTQHIQSPFVYVGEETPVYNYGFSDYHIMPKRGDKANWRKDEKVIVDVLNRDGFSDYLVYKDNSLVKKESIPESNCIDLGIMPYGDYRMCLSNDLTNSEFVYWIVADYSVNAENTGSRTAKVTFASNNATPLWLTWRTPVNYNSINNDMPYWTEVISEKNINDGYIVTELDQFIANKYKLDTWSFKVAFSTKYGIITSDFVEVDNFCL